MASDEVERPRDCDWCGQPVEVIKAAGYGFTVECVNETCQVGPSLNITRGRANAIKAWNTRAPSTGDAVSREAVMRALCMMCRDPHYLPARQDVAGLWIHSAVVDGKARDYCKATAIRNLPALPGGVDEKDQV